jgi:hypothetical protein
VGKCLVHNQNRPYVHTNGNPTFSEHVMIPEINLPHFLGYDLTIVGHIQVRKGCGGQHQGSNHPHTSGGTMPTEGGITKVSHPIEVVMY